MQKSVIGTGSVTCYFQPLLKAISQLLVIGWWSVIIGLIFAPTKKV